MKKLELVYIDKSKECLKFLEDRLKLENYRGIQISQHNRYCLEDILIILKTFYNHVGKEKMEIRTTDISKRPENLPNEEKYAKFVNEVNKKMNRGTQDSIRKNLFVDLERMGLLKRYSDKNTIKSVSITDKGIQLINPKLDKLKRQMKYSECIDELLKGFAIKIINILTELDKISLLEFTLFVSFVDKNIGNKVFLEDDIIELVKDFRSLSAPQRELIENKIKEYATPDNFKGNKKEKKDYHNWKNESQQIINLLNQTALYEYDKNRKILNFKCNKENSLFKKEDIEKLKLKRSRLEKEKYFNQHNVTKQKGYELHHVVPLLKAKNAEHFFLLDVWENLLYIDGKKHAEITQNGNRQIILNILENNDIKLTDLENDLYLKFNDNVFYSVNNKEKMKKTNKELLETL